MSVFRSSLAALLLSGASLAHALPHYTVTAIAPAGSYAQDINNAGAIVGYSGAQSAFIFANGSYTTHSAPGASATWFDTINNQGVVLGGAFPASGPSIALRYVGGGYTAYPPPAGYSRIGLWDINDSGTMVGAYSDGHSHAFIDSGGGPQPLVTQVGDSTASAINNSGAVVGSVRTNGSSQAVVFGNGGYSLLGNFSDSSAASAISDSGWMGGYYTISAHLNGAFLQDPQGNMTLYSLPNRELFLYDINNSGLAVGAGWVSADPQSFAYLYADGTAVDLNTRLVNGGDWSIVAASGINDSGQIVGTGCRQASGVCQAVLLEVSPVPEPATWGMLLAGLATVSAGGYRARRRSQV